MLLLALAALLWRNNGYRLASRGDSSDGSGSGGDSSPSALSGAAAAASRPPPMEGDIGAPGEGGGDGAGDGGAAVPSDPYTALKQNYDAIVAFTTTVRAESATLGDQQLLYVRLLSALSWQTSSRCPTGWVTHFSCTHASCSPAPSPSCPRPPQVQNVLDVWAATLERIQSLLTWRDPTASGVLLASLLGYAAALLLLGVRPLLVLGLLWIFRPPALRDPCPPPPANFIGRLPTRSDTTL